MEAITKLNKWANAHTNYGFDLLRVLLGSFLAYKGISFMAHTDLIMRVLDPVDTFGWTMFIAHYLTLAHLFGGILIVIGLFTRISIMVQLPILISAVLLNFIGEMVVFNLIQAVFALLLSAFFVIYGSGRHSVDYELKMKV